MRTYGINASVLNLPRWTGVERYVFELLNEMKTMPLETGERVVLYCAEPVEALNPLPVGWSWKVLKWPFPKGWTHGRLSIELSLHPPDVFFAPGHEVPFFGGQEKTVFTIHDVAFRVVPGLYSDLDLSRQESAVRQGLEWSDKLLTVSEATANDLHNLFNVSYDRITVTHLALPSHMGPVEVNANILQKYGLKEKEYLLYVGRVEQKKNIATLIEAFSKAEKMGVSLAIAGSDGYGAEEIKEAAKEGIKFLGYVPDEYLPSLYAGALAYLFPSKYEGFGIPVLEAFQAKTPVVASDIPALREVASDAALFVDPLDVSGWTQAIERIIGDELLRESFVKKAIDRLQAFSWKKTAEKTWKVLRDV